MAIYHLHDQEVGLNKNAKRPIAMAAYRSATRLVEEVQDSLSGISVDIVHDYSNKSDVLFSEIAVPDFAPSWMQDRNALWQAVTFSEKRKDAVYCNELNAAIPIELNGEQAIALVKEYVRVVFTNRGMIADYSIHWKEGNPHVHIMQTTRDITQKGFGKKNREWHRKEGIRFKRKEWARIVNEHLFKHGFETSIDHRSYKEQGVDLVPTKHEGSIADELEMREIVSELRKENHQIVQENIELIKKDPAIVLQKLSSQKATFTRDDIAKTLFKQVRGDEENFNLLLYKVMQHKELVQVTEKDLCGKERYSYKPYYDMEQQLFLDVQDLKEESSAINEQRFLQICEGGQISKEQVDAAYHVIAAPNIGCMIGRAGAGKTTTLKVIADYYKAQDYIVKGAALAGVAARNLEREAGIEARTLASWHKGWKGGTEKDALCKKNVFIVDEAGMLDTKTMQYTVAYAKQHGAKIVLVGDEEQLQPIAAGQAFRGIVDKIGAAEITQIHRQKAHAWMRKATQDLAEGDIRSALSVYNEYGCIQWEDNKSEAIDRMVDNYISDTEKEPDKTRAVLAYTRDDVVQLNNRIRKTLKKRGELQRAVLFQTASGKKEFAIGDQVLFLENERMMLDVRNGTIGQVVAIKKGELIIALPDQRTVSLNSTQYNKITHGYAMTLHKSQGVTVDKAYTLLDKHYDRHSTYVSLSRHREVVQIYADRFTFKGLDHVISRLSQATQQHLATDYVIDDSNKCYYKNVERYIAITKDIIDHNTTYWSQKNIEKEENLQDWERYKTLLKERSSLAKNIDANYNQYKMFLKEAHISRDVLKRHMISPKNRDKGEPARKGDKAKREYSVFMTDYKKAKKAYVDIEEIIIRDQKRVDHFVNVINTNVANNAAEYIDVFKTHLAALVQGQAVPDILSDVTLESRNSFGLRKNKKMQLERLRKTIVQDYNSLRKVISNLKENQKIKMEIKLRYEHLEKAKKHFISTYDISDRKGKGVHEKTRSRLQKSYSKHRNNEIDR